MGLATVSLTLPNGERLEEQRPVSVLESMFLKWAMALVFCDEVRDLPDLEKVVKELVS